MTNTITFPSREVRDIVLKSGLEHGVRELYDKLAAVIAANDAQVDARA